MNEIRYSSYNPIIPPEVEKFFPFGFEIEERNEAIIDAIEAVFGKNGVVSLMGPHLPTFASIYAHVPMYLDKRGRWGWFWGVRFMTEDDAFLAKMMFGGKSLSGGSSR
jgi:hypothetical protein